ncbi:MAG: TonB-dependent receptor, partial [Phaeodactylibacter sp.]|nr:TonB-dependent receptor [Phaeodactylibacter sp.]
GFELQWTWMITKFLELEQAADFVQSYNLNTGLALPFTPQPALKHDLRYTYKAQASWLEEWYVEAEHAYYFAAQGRFRVDRSEQPTPAYQLWNLSSGVTMHLSGQELRFNIQVQNLLDTYYLNHLSRYRLINVPEQGRNVVFSLKMPFSAKLKKRSDKE